MSEAAEDELAERDWHFGVDVVGRLHGEIVIELNAKPGALAFLAKPIGGWAGEVFENTFERGTLLFGIETEFTDGSISLVGTEMPALEWSASSSPPFSKMSGGVGGISSQGVAENNDRFPRHITQGTRSDGPDAIARRWR